VATGRRPRSIILRPWRQWSPLLANVRTQFHPILIDVSRHPTIDGANTHVVERHYRTIRIDGPTLIKEVPGSFDGVQYDDNLPKNMERQDIPCRSCQKRTFAKERDGTPCVSENLV